MNDETQNSELASSLSRKEENPCKRLLLEEVSTGCRLTFGDLPEEIYHEILLLLDWRDMLCVEQLSQSWRSRGSASFYWKRFCELRLNVELIEDTPCNWKETFKGLVLQQAPQHMPAFAKFRPITDTRSCIILSSDRLQILQACKEYPTNQAAMADRPFLWNSHEHYNLEAIQVPPSECDSEYVSPDSNIKYRLCKRRVRYYELVMEAKNSQNATVNRRSEYITIEKCIAIGLAHNDFPEVGVMPGWLRESYAYHSDDGKIFHGNVARTYGPKFAQFDNEHNSSEESKDTVQNTNSTSNVCVVGCGLDLIHRRIFFTLNGKFLGFAFDNVPRDSELYPTVGLDTDALVTCNFGMKPFAFDLNAFERNFMNEMSPPTSVSHFENDSLGSGLWHLAPSFRNGFG